ncbi:MAG: hypothetical protein ACOYK6_00070 [Chthoniobacterales bacterium]
MKKVTVSDSKDPIKQTPSFLEPWRVVHLPYPRETTEYSYVHVQWIDYWKIKLPRVSLQKRTLEKPGLSVNYDLLCQQLEYILNREEAEGYKLSSIYPTHSGFYSVSTVQKRPHHQFLKTATPSHHLQAKEALILVFKKNIAAKENKTQRG